MVIGSILVMAAPLKSIFDLVALTTPLGIQFPVSIVTRIEAGLTVGQALSAPNASNNGVYLIVTASGTGTAPAPTEALSVGNWVLSQGIGANWTKVNLSSAIAGIGDQDVLVAGASLVPAASGIAGREDLDASVLA
jgi:hypothetical protein